MLTGKDFIVFSDNWGRHPFSCQHIMKNFIGENRVLWVNTIGMRNPRFTLYDFRRSADIVSGWCTPKKKHQCSAEPDNLTIIKPIMTPYHQISWIRAINNKSVFKSVSNKAAELGFRRPIIVTTLPHTAESVLMFDSAAVVYYCVDDFTFWPGINRSFILSMEELLLKKADLLFASADELCRKKERNGRRPHLLPHGVDFDHFNAGAVCSVSPEPLANISAPIVGFFGALSAWLDYELLSELAVLRPDWSFVYIGPADTDVSLLSRHPNVYLLGKVSYADLPAYASRFDVGLIPFVIDEMTVSVNPLKLLEYMALGIPIVSTRLPELKKYGSLVSVGDTASDFSLAIDSVLNENSKDMRELRIATAKKASWQSIAEQFSSTVAEYLHVD